MALKYTRQDTGHPCHKGLLLQLSSASLSLIWPPCLWQHSYTKASQIPKSWWKLGIPHQIYLPQQSETHMLLWTIINSGSLRVFHFLLGETLPVLDHQGMMRLTSPSCKEQVLITSVQGEDEVQFFWFGFLSAPIYIHMVYNFINLCSWCFIALSSHSLLYVYSHQ